MSRLGDWMQTFTGRAFWPLDPRVEEVCLEDIAHALALQNRYAGHTREPYSVAEHSVRVALRFQPITWCYRVVNTSDTPEWSLEQAMVFVREVL